MRNRIGCGYSPVSIVVFLVTSPTTASIGSLIVVLTSLSTSPQVLLTLACLCKILLNFYSASSLGLYGERRIIISRDIGSVGLSSPSESPSNYHHCRVAKIGVHFFDEIVAPDLRIARQLVFG